MVEAKEAAIVATESAAAKAGGGKQESHNARQGVRAEPSAVRSGKQRVRAAAGPTPICTAPR